MKAPGCLTAPAIQFRLGGMSVVTLYHRDNIVYVQGELSSVPKMHGALIIVGALMGLSYLYFAMSLSIVLSHIYGSI